jgi:hypothetical protein
MGAFNWSSFLVPIAVGLSFALFRRAFPVRPEDGEETPFTDEERREYHRWEKWSVLPAFTFVPLLGYAWYVPLKFAADQCHQATSATQHLIRPDPMLWALPAFFLGIISAAIPMEWLYRCLLRD